MTEQELANLPLRSILVIGAHWRRQSASLAEVFDHYIDHGESVVEVLMWWPNGRGEGGWNRLGTSTKAIDVIAGPIETAISSRDLNLAEDVVMDLLDPYLPSTELLHRGDVIPVAYGTKGRQLALIEEVHRHYLMAHKYSASTQRWTRTLRRIDRVDIMGPADVNQARLLPLLDL